MIQPVEVRPVQEAGSSAPGQVNSVVYVKHLGLNVSASSREPYCGCRGAKRNEVSLGDLVLRESKQEPASHRKGGARVIRENRMEQFEQGIKLTHMSSFQEFEIEDVC